MSVLFARIKWGHVCWLIKCSAGHTGHTSFINISYCHYLHIYTLISYSLVHTKTNRMIPGFFYQLDIEMSFFKSWQLARGSPYCLEGKGLTRQSKNMNFRLHERISLVKSHHEHGLFSNSLCLYSLHREKDILGSLLCMEKENAREVRGWVWDVFGLLTLQLL